MCVFPFSVRSDVDLLSSTTVAFLQYPYDVQAKCHKGFAFVVLKRHGDVPTCLSKQYRSWFYVQGKPSQAGFNAQGRCYLRIRSARIEQCHAKDIPTELVFSPVEEESVGLRDFKLLVEDVVSSLGVTIVKSEGVLDGRRKFVHLHTVDAESAAVAKMFTHQFREKDVTISVRYARKPKVAAKSAAAVAAVQLSPADEFKTGSNNSAEQKKKLVLEPITENYGKFGISYAEATKPSTASTAAASKSSVASSASSASKTGPSSAPARPIVANAVQKQRHTGKGKHNNTAGRRATTSTELAGTA